MKKLIIFLIGLAIITWFSFCLAQEPKQAKAIEAQAGESFTITLEANKTTGYEWQFAKPLDESIVQLISLDYLIDKTELMGAGGKQIWVLKALKAGKTVIYFKYVRSWEKDIPPVNEETFIIVIKK